MKQDNPKPEKDKTRKLLDEYIKDWRGLLDTFTHPVSIHDTNLNIVTANKAAYNLYGDIKDAKNTKGRNSNLRPECRELFNCASSSDEDCLMVKSLKSGKPEKSEFYEPSLKKFLLENTSPIITNGNIVGIMRSFTDMTEVKKSEEEQGELIDVYASAINELKVIEQKSRRGKQAFFNMLEDVSDSYKELQELFIKLISTMVSVIDAKSPWTKGHSERTTQYAVAIGRELKLDENALEALRLGGLLHDIGKIGTEDHILDKPGKLTPDEFELVKNHPSKGVLILKHINQLQEIIPIIKDHHERVNGDGYPDGLKGDEISILARILHVADSYDAMRADRPYRKALSKESAIAELKQCSGGEFDPKIVEAFLKVINP